MYCTDTQQNHSEQTHKVWVSLKTPSLLKITIILDMILCSVTEMYQHFGGIWCLYFEVKIILYTVFSYF